MTSIYEMYMHRIFDWVKGQAGPGLTSPDELAYNRAPFLLSLCPLLVAIHENYRFVFLLQYNQPLYGQ